MFVIFTVIAGTPLSLIPTKNSLVKMFYGSRKVGLLTTGENLVLTFTLITICYLFACTVPNISDVITVTGATINPFISFIFPVLINWKLAKPKLISISVTFGFSLVTLILVVSVSTLVDYFKN